jgi:hypothetical protein
MIRKSRDAVSLGMSSLVHLYIASSTLRFRCCILSIIQWNPKIIIPQSLRCRMQHKILIRFFLVNLMHNFIGQLGTYIKCHI